MCLHLSRRERSQAGRIHTGLIVFLVVTAVVILVVVLVATAAPPGPTRVEAVRAGHPRLFISSFSRADLQRRCQTSHEKPFQDLKNHAEPMLGTPMGADWKGLQYLYTFAFMYQMTDDARYANKVGEMLDGLAGGWPNEARLSAAALKAGSVAYDWCHAALDDGRRQRIARAIVRAAANLELEPRPGDYSDALAVDRLALLWAGTALAGDGLADLQAQRWVQEGADLLRNNVIVAANRMALDSGGHPEGYQLAASSYLPALAQAVELMSVARGENYYLDTPILKYDALWHVYGRRPFDGSLERADDCPSGRQWNQADEGSYMPLLAARYGPNQDGVPGLFAWISSQIQRSQPHLLWTDILWDDPGVAPTPPEALPTARLFRGIGWAAMRSGWSRREDTFALFQCGPFYARYQHLDNNSFVIHKIRPLAVDSGVSEPTAHRANYSGRTVAHNTVVVIDDAEMFPDAIYPGDAPALSAAPVGPPNPWRDRGPRRFTPPGAERDKPGLLGAANDGGQLRLVPPMNAAQVQPGSDYDTGRVVAYEHHPVYTYVAGDAANGYAAAKLNSFTRQFVYIRPNLFIIFDRLAATRNDFKTRWLLHTLVEPKVDGNLVTVLDRAGAKLFCQTLLPDPAELKVVGGGGKEFQVGDQNYPPRRDRDNEAGQWRLEVVDPRPGPVQNFLHVLYACDRPDEPMPKIDFLGETRRVGVRGQQADVAFSVWFDRYGPVGGFIDLTRGRAPIVAKPFPGGVIQDTPLVMVNKWFVDRMMKPKPRGG